jgi:hypothetical protein
MKKRFLRETRTIDSDITNDIAVQIYTSNSDGVDIVFEYNSKHIAMSIFPSHSSQDSYKS